MYEFKITKNKDKLIPWQVVRDENFTKEEQMMSDLRVQLKITLRKLRETRKKLRLTQKDLAKLSGLPRTTISKIESGYQNPSLVKVIKIADAMDRDVQITFLSRNPKSKAGNRL